MRLIMASQTMQADKAERTITGLLVPFGAVASPAVGPAQVRFAADGDHKWTKEVWLNEEHASSVRLGKAKSLTVTEAGIEATFAIMATQRGNDALVEAAEGARDGLSVEATIIDYETEDDGTVVVIASLTEGAALTYNPAFDSARVSYVAATQSETQQEEEPVTETVVPQPITMTSSTVTASRQPSAGEWIHAALTGDHDKLAAMRETIRAAAPHTLSTDVNGLIPTPIVGELMKLYKAESPLFDALGNRTAPNTNVFQIPLVTTRVDAAAAAAEKTDVTKQLAIKDVIVEMVALKRAVNLSEEAILYSQLDLLAIAAEQLAESVISGREAYAAATISAVTGQNAKVTIALDGSDAWDRLSGASATAATAVGSRPTLAALDPTTWSKLAGFTNSLGAPLISGVNPTLDGSTGTLFGLPVVVSPALSKSYLIDKRLVHSYSNGNIRMRVDEPTILGRAIGALHSVGVGVGSGKALTEIAVATA
jgi:HK97 family phage major capsid protein